MKFFIIDDVNSDPRYCFVDPILPCSDAFADGMPARPDLQKLQLDVLELQMDEDEGGLQLPDLVSNTDNLLPLRRSCAQAIVDGFEVGPHELLDSHLINEKERVHSEDYAILNPLGEIDCLNQAASEMDGDDEFPNVKIMGRWCLARDRLPADRDLFRVTGVIGYIFSERLVSFIQSEGYTNFRFLPVALC